MRNTEKTRLARLGKITSNLQLTDFDSIKSFADRMRKEAEVLNIMAQEVVVSDVILMSIFKTRIYEKFGNEGHYYTALTLLASTSPRYSFEDLVV